MMYTEDEYKALETKVTNLNTLVKELNIRLIAATEALHEAETQTNKLDCEQPLNAVKEENYKTKYINLKANINLMLSDAINKLEGYDPEEDLYKAVDELVAMVCSRQEITKKKLEQSFCLNDDDVKFLVDVLDHYKDPSDD